MNTSTATAKGWALRARAFLLAALIATSCALAFYDAARGASVLCAFLSGVFFTVNLLMRYVGDGQRRA